MGRLTPSTHPDLLVGTASGDDAAVWRLDADRALIATADFITPVVDDARTWGRVAAANAVSDVYAMGGRPLLALNLVGWNTEALSIDLLGEVLAGGQDIAEAAGFVVAGGHTVDDPEPKYGMAVIGEVHPDKLLTNRGLRAGDHLVLTKPLGIGVITNTPSPIARDVLAHVGLEPDVLVGGTDVPQGKPAPDMVFKALTRLDVPKENAVLIGDSDFDRGAATAARIHYVHYNIETGERLDRVVDGYFEVNRK